MRDQKNNTIPPLSHFTILLPISHIYTQEKTSIPEDRQRLIYRGRVLQDANLLSFYSLESGHTVHCVSRPTGGQANNDHPNGAPTSMATGGGGNRRIMMGAIAIPTTGTSAVSRMLSEAIGGVGGGMAVASGPGGGPFSIGGPRFGHQLPIGSHLVGAGQVPPAALNPQGLEHIRQSLMTLHTIISGLDAPEDDEEARDDRRRRMAEETAAGVGILPSSSSSTITTGGAGAAAAAVEPVIGSSSTTMMMAEEEEAARSSGDDDEEEEGRCYHLMAETRRFFIGQWLDVKVSLCGK